MAAARAASRLAGVQAVANEIEVGLLPEDQHVKGVINRIMVHLTVNTAVVKSQIEAALKHSAELDAQRITVETRGDTVILRGSVRSWAERQEAECAAWAASGVAKVENHLAIVL